MTPIFHMGEVYYPISRNLISFLKPDGASHIHVPSLQGKISEPEIVFLKELDYFNYQKKLKSCLSNQKTLTKENTLLLSGVLDNLFQELSSESLSTFPQFMHLILELSGNAELKKLFAQSLTHPNAKTTFVRSILCYNLAIKSGSNSTYFLNRLMMSSLFCDFVSVDSPVFHGIGSALVLEGLPSIPSDVPLAIRHHHEFNDGSGPLKLRQLAIHPLAKYVRLADELSGLGGKSKNDFNLAIEKLQYKIDAPLLKLIRK